MDRLENEFNYSNLTNGATGDQRIESKKISCSFGKYEIIIRLSVDNKFLGIEAIKIKKEFIDSHKKASLKGYHDVEEYYE